MGVCVWTVHTVGSPVACRYVLPLSHRFPSSTWVNEANMSLYTHLDHTQDKSDSFTSQLRSVTCQIKTRDPFRHSLGWQTQWMSNTCMQGWELLRTFSLFVKIYRTKRFLGLFMIPKWPLFIKTPAKQLPINSIVEMNRELFHVAFKESCCKLVSDWLYNNLLVLVGVF